MDLEFEGSSRLGRPSSTASAFPGRSLVLREEWAQKYAQRPGTTVVESTDDITGVLINLAQQGEQLTLM